jgi:hypothetical protein
MAEGMEDRHQRRQEHSDALYSQANPKTLTITTLRGANLMGRCSPLSGSDPRYTVDLVISHRPG